MSDWQLASDTAAAYERHLVPVLFAPLADRLIERAAPRPDDRVLDLACGTGIVARRIAPRVRTVTGLDLSDGMLAVARAADPSIRWLEGDAAALPLADASVDLVLCQQGMQFFGDRAAVVRELGRVLAPGGRLVAAAWRAPVHNPGWLRLAEALDRHAGAEVGAAMRAPFALGGEELRAALLAGFADVELRIEILPVRFPSAREMLLQEEASFPMEDEIAALSEAEHEALVGDFEAAMAAYADDAGVTFAMEATVAAARHFSAAGQAIR
jgi:SAM-dependent methyltransferase